MKYKNLFLKITVVMIVSLLYNITYVFADELTTQTTFTESFEVLNNPDIGFYNRITIYMDPRNHWRITNSSYKTVIKGDGTITREVNSKNYCVLPGDQKTYAYINPNTSTTGDEYCSLTQTTTVTNTVVYEGLVQVRIDLSEFSEKVNGVQNYDITREHIDKLNEILNKVRDGGGTVILRFAYDKYEGIVDLEPDMDYILNTHIPQLEDLFTENEDIIALVESSFIGRWGEQNASTIITDENLKLLVDKLLQVVPQSRTINFRYPGKFCYVSGCDLNNLENVVLSSSNKYYRLGIFNDGYLGSECDLKTFYWNDQNQRKVGLSFLNKQATHTFYGGEATMCGGDWCKNLIYDENNNLYYSSTHMIEEMFITHTSYLSSIWNSNVLEGPNKDANNNRYGGWKTDIYSGEDAVYNGKSAYLYIENHLGYRLVLNSTTIPKQVKQNRTTSININLKNVGAGNVVNEKSTYIVLKNETNEYTIKTSIDVRKWLSKDIQDINVSLPIEKDMQPGNYEVYLKITNKGDKSSVNKRTIRFANNDVWNEAIGANKIGNIEIVKNIDIEAIETDLLKIDNENRIIYIYKNNMSVEDILNLLKQNDYITIYNKDNVLVEGEEKVSTGYTLQFNMNEYTATYEINVEEETDNNEVQNPATDASLKYRIIILIIAVSGLSYIFIKKKSVFQRHS